MYFINLASNLTQYLKLYIAYDQFLYRTVTGNKYYNRLTYVATL